MNHKFNAILQNETYKMYLKEISKHESTRIFCKHNLEHFLNVARIASILNLENRSLLSQDLIYATALLHDIGRHVQYEKGTPHEISSAHLCVDLLKDAKYSDAEVDEIQKAILNHRTVQIKTEKSLSGYIYAADKLSRACFACEVADLCDWPIDKKNMTINY